MESEDRGSKVDELLMRLAVRRGDPRGCGGKPCAIAASHAMIPCPDGIGMYPGKYIGGEGYRIAEKGNKRFKCGERHRQCADCRAREKNEAEIRFLKCELGFKI